jgi:hypothetical protein
VSCQFKFCEEEESDINIDEVCNDPMYSEMLNGIITEKEVLDAIKGFLFESPLDFHV